MLLFNSQILLPTALLLTLVFLLHRLLLSPLARLPGPVHTCLTSLPLKLAEFRGQRTLHIHALHLRYGAIVRIAPNQVSFSSAAAVREIYASGGSGYDKTEFYDLFTVYGRRTMFSTREKAPHAERKRALADRYANSNVVRGESLQGIEERSRRFVARVVAAAAGAEEGTEMDVYTALHAYAFDCASHHIFHPLGADSLRSAADERIMLEVTTDASLQNRLVRYYAPRLLHPLLGFVLARVLGAPPRETPLADGFVLDAVAKAEAGAARPFTLVSRLSEQARWGLDETAVAAECLDHMVAGIDTTGDALCFLMWELSLPRSRRVQERLRGELRGAKEEEEAEDGGGWEKLVYLDAVVMEGLRCFPAIPMSLPRYVPGGGRTIDGVAIPAGTIVSSQAHSVHRIDTHVFPDPDAFVPERWLAVEGDAERKRAFFAFASGGRGCVGRHLAIAEMKILLRDVYARYATLPGEGMEEGMMVMEDQLISARPRAQRCMLRFVEADG